MAPDATAETVTRLGASGSPDRKRDVRGRAVDVAATAATGDSAAI